MTNDDLKSIWAEQTKDVSPPAITPEVIWRLSKESARFERTIFWRDTREWIATVFVAVNFFWFGLRDGHVHWMPIAAAIVVCFPMTYATLRRRKRPAPESTGSLIDHLRESIASVQHQIGLLRSVLWWYLAPCAVSVMLVFFEVVQLAPRPFDAKAYFWMGRTLTFAAVLNFVLWKANQRAVRKSLEPRLRALQETLNELQT